MLLIDTYRSVRSLRPATAGCPFVYERLGQDSAAIRAFLAQIPVTPWFTQALEGELTRHAGALSPAPRDLDDWLNLAARAIAAGIVAVAAAVPDPVSLSFDPSHLWVRHGRAAVVFPSAAVATAFLRAALRDPAVAAALQQAVASFRAADVPGANVLRPWDARDPIPMLVPPLLTQRLALVSTSPTGQFPTLGKIVDWRFQLRWMEHAAPPGVADPAPPPTRGPAPPPPSPPPRPSAASILPDPPVDVSPQAQTLIDAAKSGVPFCEECARAAAAANV